MNSRIEELEKMLSSSPPNTIKQWATSPLNKFVNEFYSEHELEFQSHARHIVRISGKLDILEQKVNTEMESAQLISANATTADASVLSILLSKVESLSGNKQKQPNLLRG